MKRLALILALLSTNGFAATWDLANDFSLSANPNGAWTYGYTTSTAGTLTPWTSEVPFSGYTVLRGSMGMYGGPYLSSGIVYFPNISKWVGEKGLDVLLTTGSSIVNAVSNGGVSFHPGPTNQMAVAEWTASVTGYYFINSLFRSCDTVGATTDVHVLVKGTAVFNGTVTGISSVQSWSGASTGYSLLSGDKVRIVVGNNGTWGNDCTIVDTKIVTPNPSIVR